VRPKKHCKVSHRRRGVAPQSGCSSNKIRQSPRLRREVRKCATLLPLISDSDGENLKQARRLWPMARRSTLWHCSFHERANSATAWHQKNSHRRAGVLSPPLIGEVTADPFSRGIGFGAWIRSDLNAQWGSGQQFGDNWLANLVRTPIPCSAF
jgi:hypothetical protein